MPIPTTASRGAALALRDPSAPGRQPAQPAADQQTEHHHEAPDRKEEQGQDSSILRFGLQQPFEDANRRDQAERAAGQGGEQNGKFLRDQVSEASWASSGNHVA
jgi:hypothetical protein